MLSITKMVAGKVTTVIANVIKIGAILHCTVEYIGDFVIVREHA